MDPLVLDFLASVEQDHAPSPHASQPAPARDAAADPPSQSSPQCAAADIERKRQDALIRRKRAEARRRLAESRARRGGA